ncbi:hypothetical protein AVO45_15720 [Ruegeria marisrubri]|uniref:Uncharacterized protein n=1 Tax=Ruegeria marisrubri TaxID=1685379 RepID=A0A0X3TBR0_9RHOB|nr:hypothetical protein [Ruegeria marisrubri]KUJ73188.1 hypothetical protein AVO45_15720 [Ruegeria marisrubri]
MHPDLRTRRSVVFRARLAYDEADAAYRAEVRRAAELVPEAHRRYYWSIGNPGSPVRRLYERRDRALQRLNVALVKLEAARERMAARNARLPATRILLLAR